MNCTQVAKKRKEKLLTQKRIDIDKFLCIKVYKTVKSFCPALIRPPLGGPTLISAQAERFFIKQESSHSALFFA